MIYDENLKA